LVPLQALKGATQLVVMAVLAVAKRNLQCDDDISIASPSNVSVLYRVGQKRSQLTFFPVTSEHTYKIK